jgi:hypothetical protein
MKNEARYLDEWIKYHLIKGVDFFYILYDPKSEDYRHACDIVDKYRCICFMTGDTYGKQQEFYNNIIKEAKDYNKWMAFIDADEFLWSQFLLKEILRHTKKTMVYIPWVHFSYNWQKDYYDDLVVERFPKHHMPVSTTTKFILRVDNFNRVNIVSPHYGFGVDPNRWVENWKEISNEIYCCHYFTKSLKEYNFVKNRTDAWCGNNRSLFKRDFEAESMMDAHLNYSLKEYGPQIKNYNYYG